MEGLIRGGHRSHLVTELTCPPEQPHNGGPSVVAPFLIIEETPNMGAHQTIETTSPVRIERRSAELKGYCSGPA